MVAGGGGAAAAAAAHAARKRTPKKGMESPSEAMSPRKHTPTAQWAQEVATSFILLTASDTRSSFSRE